MQTLAADQGRCRSACAPKLPGLPGRVLRRRSANRLRAPEAYRPHLGATGSRPTATIVRAAAAAEGATAAAAAAKSAAAAAASSAPAPSTQVGTPAPSVPGIAVAPAISSSTSTSTSSKAAVTSAWPCKGGGLVQIVRQGGNQQDQLSIQLDTSLGGSSRVPPGSTVELHWGVYRSSPHLWQHPPEVVPPGSSRDERSGAMCTAMAAADEGATHTVTLSVPSTLAPLTLAFVICVTPPAAQADTSKRPPRRHFITPLHGRHFSALIGTSGGSAARQGATLESSGSPAAAPGAAPAPGPSSVLARAGGAAGQQQQQQHTVNFAVRCRGVDRVSLVLLRPHGVGQGGEWGMLEVVLDPVLNRSGDMWHVAVEGLHSLDGLCYGWRVEGDVGWESGYRVQPYQLLLDPYSPSLRYFPADMATEASALPLPIITLPDGSSRAVLSSLEGVAAAAEAGPAAVAAAEQLFVPGPGHSLEEMRLLELDVRTFAQGKGVQHPGTFLGVAERVGHIKAVGANTVLLTPSYATAKGIGLMARAAVHYMAADPLLACAAGDSSAAAAAEFRAMLSALHAAGIEVLLMLDLTFTAEGTDTSPHTLCLRGLDHAAHYRANGVLNCGDPATRSYLLDVLRHWADEGVDGFCFINAENLVQDRFGTVLDAPPLAEAVCHDPRLRALKLVALASDDSLLPRGGARGFPHWALWMQRNTGWGADLLAYMAEGTSGLLTAVAGRLMGSAAVFDADWASGLPGNLAAGRRPAFGINSITVLGRQSLPELCAEAAELAAAAVAYGGARAPPPSAATISKSLLALAVLSLGVPVVPQDAVAELAAAHFVGVLMRLRRRLAPLLLPPRFDSPRDIRWHAADASVAPIWDAELAGEAAGSGKLDTSFLAFSVRGPEGQSVYVGVNPHPHPVTARLPPPPPGRVWERIVDTSRAAPDDALLEGGEPITGGVYQLASKAVLVLQTAVVETPGFQAQQQQAYPAVQQAQQVPTYASPQTQTSQLTPQQLQLRRLLLTQQQEAAQEQTPGPQPGQQPWQGQDSVQQPWQQ